MTPVKAEREMPVMAMMPHVMMMPVSAVRVMPVTVTPAFDLDDRPVEIIRISLRRAASERKRRCGRSEQHRAGRERQKSDCSHDFPPKGLRPEQPSPRFGVDRIGHERQQNEWLQYRSGSAAHSRCFLMKAEIVSIALLSIPR